MPEHRVCPWWLGYFLASPLRRLVHNPSSILSSYVREGMKVLEPGPGMGFFTLELARLVGVPGRIIAVEIQPKMLAALKRRVAKAGFSGRVDARLGAPHTMGLADVAGSVDFALAFAIVHELPAAGPFFQEVAQALKPGGSVLLAEPSGHVTGQEFAAELEAAAAAGLHRVENPRVPRSRAALLRKAA